MRAESTFPSPYTTHNPDSRFDRNPSESARDDTIPGDCARPNPPRMSAAIVAANPSYPLPIPATSLSHTEPELVLSAIAQRTNASSVNVEPTELRSGVYIGEGRAKSGEKFFLRMEKVDASNYLFWLLYLAATDLFAEPNRGLLSRLMSFTTVVEHPGGKKQFANKLGSDIVARQVGMDAEEFQQLINALGQGGYYSAQAGGKKSNALLQLAAGSEHLPLKPQGNVYVTFASRRSDILTTDIPSGLDADTDLATIKIGDRAYQGFPWVRPAQLKFLSEAAYNIFKAMRLKDYFNLYGDLLMCVGTELEPGKSCFENRGIFRNPYSVIKNDYKGISMMLHGFTGAVARKYFPELTMMRVRPITSMQQIIFNTMKRGDYTIPGQTDIGRVIERCDEQFRDGVSSEIEIHIKVEALALLYANHASD